MLGSAAEFVLWGLKLSLNPTPVRGGDFQQMGEVVDLDALSLAHITDARAECYACGLIA